MSSKLESLPAVSDLTKEYILGIGVLGVFIARTYSWPRLWFRCSRVGVLFCSTRENHHFCKLFCKGPLIIAIIETRVGFLCKKKDDISMDKHPSWGIFFYIDLLLKQLFLATWVPVITDSMISSHFGNFKKMEEKKKSRIRSFNNDQQKLFEDF